MIGLGDRGPARMRQAPDDSGEIRVDVLNGFVATRRGRAISLDRSGRRLLSYLALQDRPLHRDQLAAALWPDETRERARSHLRATIWRIRSSGVSLITVTTTHVAIPDAVDVDVRQVTETCHRILAGEPCEQRLVDILLRSGDPLPDLDEEWAAFVRARVQQLRLHALERLCEDATEHGDFGHAIEACLAAVSEDPLRESAHRALIRLYLAEGNRNQALLQFEKYRTLMKVELALPPAREIRELLSGVLSS